MKRPAFLHATFAGLAAAMIATAANGVVITINPFETPNCDPLIIPNVVHELGIAPLFPPDELIMTVSTFTDQSACPMSDNPNVPNVLVVMTNLTPTFWHELHYVGDAGPNGPETFLTNDDGLITGGLAFRIDTVGVNTPLVFESIAGDMIFAPGEIWHFIIQDYGNIFGLSPAAMGSIGVGFGSGGDTISSGSIVALEVPSPGSLALLAISAITLYRRRR
jgi:hypothetical protein